MRRRAATAMGLGGRAVCCIGALLWRRAVLPGAGPASGVRPQLRLLSVRRLKAGPAFGPACLTADRARGLHGGPGLEEGAAEAAGEGRPESGTAGTGARRAAAAPPGKLGTR